jgi:hypothetical protein
MVGLLYLVAQSALVSLLQYGQPLLYGVLAQVKLFPVLYYLPVLFLLRTWRISTAELHRALLWLGTALVALYFAVELLIDPASVSTRARSVLIKYDLIRGYRFCLPLVFHETLVFLCFRTFLQSGTWRHLLLVLVSLAYITFWAQPRMELIAVIAVLLFATMGRRAGGMVPRLLFLGLAAAALPFLSRLVYFRQSAVVQAMLSRWDTASLCLSYLNESATHWLFGAGYLNPVLNDVTLQSLYGDQFWPSDVGWLGVVFEYGLLGATLILVFYGFLLRETWRFRAQETPPVLLALRDFVYKTLILTPLVPSVPLFAGLYVTLLAVFKYYGRGRPATGTSADSTRQGLGAPGPSIGRPESDG